MTLLTVDSRNLTGKPTPGVLKIRTSRKPIFDTQSKVTFSGEAVEPLGADGKASVELPPSNGAHTGAVFLYSFEVQLAGFGTWVVRNAFLPDMGTIDLSELHNSAPAPGEPARIIKVPADGEDGQVLVWSGAGFSWEDSPPGLRGPEGPRGPQGLRGLTGPQGPAIDVDTGLPIQVDTTVGTRVFIGGHMVHGDTGWRTITSWDTAGTITGQPLTSGLQPTAGVAGSISLRRVGKEAQFHMSGVTVTATDVRVDLPEGFRGLRPYFRQTVATSNSAFGVMFGHWLGVYVRMNGAVIDGTHGVGVVFECELAWPTVLPGTPA